MHIISSPRAVPKIAAERLHQAFAQCARQPREAVTFAIESVTCISGEQLITTIARENNGNVFTRELGNQVCRNRRRVSERLIEMPRELIHNVADFRCYQKLVMLSAEFLRGHARVLQLVITIFAEADRKSLDPAARQPAHQGRDHAGIQAAAEQHAQGHVGDQAQACRLGQHFQQPFDRPPSSPRPTDDGNLRELPPFDVRVDFCELLPVFGGGAIKIYVMHLIGGALHDGH